MVLLSRCADKRKRRTLPERIGCADRFSIGRIQERFIKDKEEPEHWAQLHMKEDTMDCM